VRSTILSAMVAFFPLFGYRYFRMSNTKEQYMEET